MPQYKIYMLIERNLILVVYILKYILQSIVSLLLNRPFILRNKLKRLDSDYILYP